MSNTTDTKQTKGVRYTPAEKQEVIDFAVSYNTANGRGGQSKAAEKFKISQLTVANWLKGAGVAKPGKKVKLAKKAKVAKAPKAAKAPKKAKIVKAPKTPKAAKSGKGRATPEEKQVVANFVANYNTENGRGGVSHAAKKFGVTPLTVIAWCKVSGVASSPKKGAAKALKLAKAPKAANAPKKAGRPAKVAKASASTGDMSGKLNSLLVLSKEIARAESDLSNLKSKFASLKASL